MADMSSPDPGLVRADQTSYTAPAARLEGSREARPSRALLVLQTIVGGLNLLQGLGVVWLCAWGLVTTGIAAVPVLALGGLPPLLNLAALWPWRWQAALNLAGLLLNIACLCIIVVLLKDSKAWFVLAGAAAMVTPQACALVLQGVTLVALWRRR